MFPNSPMICLLLAWCCQLLPAAGKKSSSNKERIVIILLMESVMEAIAQVKSTVVSIALDRYCFFFLFCYAQALSRSITAVVVADNQAVAFLIVRTPTYTLHTCNQNKTNIVVSKSNLDVFVLYYKNNEVMATLPSTQRTKAQVLYIDVKSCWLAIDRYRRHCTVWIPYT